MEYRIGSIQCSKCGAFTSLTTTPIKQLPIEQWYILDQVPIDVAEKAQGTMVGCPNCKALLRLVIPTKPIHYVRMIAEIITEE